MNRFHSVAIAAAIVVSALGFTHLAAQPTQSAPKQLIGEPLIKGIPQSARPRTSLPFNGGKAEKTAVVPSRLISSSIRPHDGSGSFTQIPSDTVDYVYSGYRGGDGTDNNPLKYDTMLLRKWDGSLGIFVPDSRDIQFFDAKDRLVGEIAQYVSGGKWLNNHLENWIYNTSGNDSIYKYHSWDSATSSWILYRRVTSTYNSSGLLDRTVEEYLDFNTNTLAPYSRTTFSYNAAGLVTNTDYESPTGTPGTWLLKSRDVQSYTSSNLLSRHTSLQRMAGPSVDSSYDFRYYYNSANQLVSSRSRNYISNDDDSSYTSSLSSSGMPLATTSYRFDGIAWNPGDRWSKTYTSSGKLSSDTWQTYNAGVWGNYMREFYFYNSFDQLIRDYHQTFYNGAWTADYSDLDYRYYYGAYNTAVKTVGSDAVPQIRLSPVPTSDVLKVNISFARPVSATIVIVDMAGRVTRKWQEGPAKALSKSIDTHALPNGQYNLWVLCDNGVSSQPFIVVR